MRPNWDLHQRLKLFFLSKRVAACALVVRTMTINDQMQYTCEAVLQASVYDLPALDLFFHHNTLFTAALSPSFSAIRVFDGR